MAAAFSTPPPAALMSLPAPSIVLQPVAITDTPTPGSVYWYKVVKVSGGTETKSRVVHTYVG